MFLIRVAMLTASFRNRLISAYSWRCEYYVLASGPEISGNVGIVVFVSMDVKKQVVPCSHLRNMYGAWESSEKDG